MSQCYTLPAGVYGGVWFREGSFTSQEALRTAVRARGQAVARFMLAERQLVAKAQAAATKNDVRSAKGKYAPAMRAPKLAGMMPVQGPVRSFGYERDQATDAGLALAARRAKKSDMAKQAKAAQEAVKAFRVAAARKASEAKKSDMAKAKRAQSVKAVAAYRAFRAARTQIAKANLPSVVEMINNFIKREQKAAEAAQKAAHELAWTRYQETKLVWLSEIDSNRGVAI